LSEYYTEPVDKLRKKYQALINNLTNRAEQFGFYYIPAPEDI